MRQKKTEKKTELIVPEATEKKQDTINGVFTVIRKKDGVIFLLSAEQFKKFESSGKFHPGTGQFEIEGTP